MITIGPLEPADRADWEQLFRDYTEFYGRVMEQELYDRAWREFLAGETCCRCDSGLAL